MTETFVLVIQYQAIPSKHSRVPQFEPALHVFSLIHQDSIRTHVIVRPSAARVQYFLFVQIVFLQRLGGQCGCKHHTHTVTSTG